MVFSSALFLFYFLPLFLAGYFITPARWRNLFTALASVLFYAWGAPNFLIIFLGSCLCDYLLVLQIEKAPTRARKRLILTASTMLNVGLLIYFKYANFFVAQLSGLAVLWGLSAPHWTKVVLPIGISFFTFHKISYVVDVFRGKSRPTQSFAEYLLYITFFPQLIAGPIVRYHEIDDQIRRRTVTIDGFVQGIWRFVIGLASKLLLADPLGTVADHVFKDNPWNHSVVYTWVGTVAYTMQIYFDFAGYSSMAVGLALMVGFRFPENFNRPYLAQSVTDFWRRWHMSLSRWMRDYLYIPLGGNRVGHARQMANLWTVFLLSGLWHGANWTFIAWGAFHGAFLALERTRAGEVYSRLPSLARRATTMLAVMFGWVLFRSDTLSDAVARWARLLGMGPQVKPNFVVPRAHVISDFGLSILVIAVAWCLFIEPLLERAERSQEAPVPLYVRVPMLYPAIAILFLLSVLALEAGQYSPFIYFQF
jgi:alginate O-acetyltransferase complex protein AlgI